MLIHNVLCLLPTLTCIPMERIIKMKLKACIRGIQLPDDKKKLLELPVYALSEGGLIWSYVITRTPFLLLFPSSH